MAVYERKEGFAKVFSKRCLLRFAIESQEQLAFYCSPVKLSESGELSGTFLSKIHRIFFIFIGKTRTTAGKAVLRRTLADGHECSYAAEMYSLFGACKVLGKNPKKWLAYFLDHIKGTKPQDMHKLLPSEWEEC